MISGRRLVEALLAVAGIWMLVRQIPDYITTIYVAAAGSLESVWSGPDVVSVQGLHFFVSAVLGTALLLARNVIARRLFPDLNDEALASDGILAAGVAIVGVYYAMSGLIDLSVLADWRPGPPADRSQLWFGAASAILGGLLFVSAGLILNFWQGISLRLRRSA